MIARKVIEMSEEYGLYSRSQKSFIWLGKAVTDPSRFQMPSDRIAKFVNFCRLGDGKIEIHSDAGDLPHALELDWVQLDTWEKSQE